MRWGGKRKGAGRPRLPDDNKRVTLSMRIHPAAKTIITRLAKAKGVSIGDAVEMMLIQLDETKIKRGAE